jgi:membrane protein implicated in regulation of membrane protease activity
LWRAVSPEEIPAGAQVRVTRIEGLTLHVVLAGHDVANA